MTQQKKEITPLQQEINDVVKKAQDLEVTDPEGLNISAEYLKACKARKKKIGEAFDDIVKKAHEAHKAATSERKKHLDPVEKAEKIIKGKVGAYQLEQEKIQRQREAEAREKARQAEEEKQLAEAQALQAEGMTEEAEAVLEEERPIEVAKVETQKMPEGVSTRDNWKFEVVDVSKLPREYIMPDTKAIGSVVKALKQNASKSIPGIRVWNEKTVVTR